MKKGLPRFWISWWQPGEDYRPLKWPLKDGIIKYWCSGYRGDEESSLCALIEGEKESKVKKLIKSYWPEAKEWRFCEKKEPGWTPGDRFPMR